MEEQGKDLQDYIVAIRKRLSAIFTIFILVFIVSLSVAFLLPSIYKSSSTILIEQQEIPTELVMSTVTSYASERIQSIKARVMSRTNLLKVIDKFELYEEERKVETTEEIVARMQDDVTLDIISADVVDPRTGRPSAATIAFSLSYKGENPAKVQRVANELTNLYLDENLSSRTQEASEAYRFFEEESDRIGKQIDELESKLATFKQEHSDALPELKTLNLSVLQRKESELTALETQLRTLEERRFFLDGQLAQIDPGNPDIPDSSTRLKLLQAQYASTRSRYSDEHPDVVRLKAEIQALQEEIGLTDNADVIAEQITLLESELVRKREVYTADHPDVIALKEKIRALNEDLQSARSRQTDDYYQESPDNPIYISTRSQLEGVKSEISSVKAQREKVLEKIAELEKVLYNAPQVEREYLILKRDYDNAVRRYQATKAKQMYADAAKQLEAESKGERFTLIDPPAYPEEPISPNRPAIIVLGLLLAAASSLGFAIIADVISGTVHGVNGIKRSLGAFPLSVIPYEHTLQESAKSGRIKKRIVILFIAVILASMFVIHIFVSPLDVLWFRILRKLEIFLV